jgi:tetratricopeptide (TPR) repeat protein
MAIKVETVKDLLDAKQWAACAELSAQGLAESESNNAESATDTDTRARQAILSYALCRSYSNLDKYGAALEPGQRAVFLAEEIRDYDLLGLALVELAEIQHRLPGVHWQAVHTLRRYFEGFERYRESARRHYLFAMYNLGVYLRAADDHEEALRQFVRAYEAAKARREVDLADRCRRNAVAQALHLHKLDQAEALIREGQLYVDSHPENDRANASHLTHQAQLLYLKGDLDEAGATAIEAVLRANGMPELVANALEVLHQIGRATGEIEGALAVAIVAKIQAEKDERYDVVHQLQASVRDLAIRYPEAVERFMRDVTKLREDD